jgi:hypothetical protein
MNSFNLELIDRNFQQDQVYDSSIYTFFCRYLLSRKKRWCDWSVTILRERSWQIYLLY